MFEEDPYEVYDEGVEVNTKRLTCSIESNDYVEFEIVKQDKKVRGLNVTIITDCEERTICLDRENALIAKNFIDKYLEDKR